MKTARKRDLNKLPPRKKSDQNLSLQAMKSQPARSREEQHEILSRARSQLTPYLDDEDRRLARAWGVTIGSNAWVELMTRHCIASQIQQNLAASKKRPTETSGTIQHSESANEVEGEQENSRSPVSDDAAGIQDVSLTPDPRSKSDADPSSLSLLSSRPPPQTPSTESPRQATKPQRLLLKFQGLKRQNPNSEEIEAATAPTSKRPRIKITCKSLKRAPAPINTAELKSTTSTTIPTPSLSASTTSTTSSSSSASTSAAQELHKCPNATCKFHAKGFKRREHLRRHVSSVHDRRIVASCDGCGAAFTRVDNAKVHGKTCLGGK